MAIRHARSTPEDVIRQLQAGNQRFIAGDPEHPHSSASRRSEVAEQGQHPIAAVLACADSRCPVELVFDQGIGDLYVVRVSGNVCGTDALGSLEHATAHVELPLVVVLGHTQCGAVQAILSGEPLHGALARLTDPIRRAVSQTKQSHPGLSPEQLMRMAVEANVRQSMATLCTQSRTIADLVSKHSVKIAGAVYDLATGQVYWLD